MYKYGNGEGNKVDYKVKYWNKIFDGIWVEVYRISCSGGIVFWNDV